jgi:N-acetylneuraminic acid mutarotase
MKFRIHAFALLLIMSISGFNSRAQWTQKVSHLGSARYDFAGFSANGKGYFGGGRYAGAFNSIAEWQQYDPATNVWTMAASMPYPFTGLSAFCIGNYGYVFDGVNDAFFNYDTYKYNPFGNNWSTLTTMPYPRLHGAPATDGINGYVIGGYGYSAEAMNDIWEYNPLTDVWTEKTALPLEAARCYATAFSTGGNIYIFGGTDNMSFFNDLWKYNPGTDQWVQMTSMPAEARIQSNSFVINDEVFVVGGTTFDGADLKEVWKYDAVNDTWLQLADFPGATGPFGGVSFVINEKGYIVTGNGTKECWEFDPNWNVNVSENERSLSLSIYPNPVINESVVTFPANGSKSYLVEIINCYGQTVKVMQISGNQVTIQQSDFATGVYFIKVHDEFMWTGTIIFTVL